MTVISRTGLRVTAIALLFLALPPLIALERAGKGLFPDASPVIDSLDFKDTEVGEVLRIISDATGWSIICSPTIRAKVTLSVKDISAEEFLQTVLDASGSRMIRKGDTILVVNPEEYAALAGRPLRIFALKSADASKVATAIQPLLTAKSKAIADPRAHSLVVADTEANSKAIEKAVRALDAAVEVQVIDLGTAKASEVAQRLQNVLSDPKNVQPDDRTHRLVITDTSENIAIASRVIAQLDKEIKPTVFELNHADAEEVVEILDGIVSDPDNLRADPRTNQIVVRETPRIIEQIRQVVSALDRPGSAETRVIQLRFADCTATAQLLKEMMGAPGAAPVGAFPPTPEFAPPEVRPRQQEPAKTESRPEATAAGSTPPTAPQPPPVLGPPPIPPALSPSGISSASPIGVIVVADERTNSVVLSGPPSTLDQLERVVKQLDIEVKTYVVQLHHVDPQAIGLEDKLGQILTATYDTFQIENLSRKVTFSTTEDKANRLKSLLAHWDTKPRQVMIEAKLMRVGLDTARDLGITFTAQKRSDSRVSVTATGQFPPEIPLVPRFSLQAGTLSATDYDVLIEALETSGDSELLSNPRILGVDGQQAVFQVVTQEPYKEVTIGSAGETTVENVEFKDVGVTLVVTPYISDMPTVTMDVSMEVSDLVEVRDGLPVVNRSLGTSRVLAEDGRTVLLGGLIIHNWTSIRKGIPILSRIPILGLFFRSSSKSLTKSELILFLTPHITSGEQTPPESFREAKEHLKTSTK